MLRVALDATPLLGRPTGVGAFTAAVLDGAARRPDVTPVAYALTWRGRGSATLRRPGVRAVRRPMAARPLRTAWARSDLPPIEWWTGRVDVVHGTNFVVPPARRAARVVTVHDLTPVRYPDLCTADTLAYPDLLRRALAGGAWIHAVSRFVADEVVEVLGADPERVRAVPNGAPDATSGDPVRGRAVAGAERYLLALGTVEPRKDLPGLVAAFAPVAADHPDLRLVIAGPDGWGADALDRAVAASPVRDRIVRTGWVEDRTRADLLAGAAALAYPSVYEGFGLPPLEAMAAGTPVVATAAGAVPEVVGDAALVVPVGDTDALAAALATVLGDEAVVERLVEAGHDRVAAFSWDRTVDELVGLWGDAHASRASYTAAR